MRRWWLPVCEVALAVVVMAAAALTFAGARAKTDGDEAEWIGTSRYFLSLFVERDFTSATWADSYWTRTQPMMARYVIGAWLWARGHDLEGLNPNYNHDVSWAANQRSGRAPANSLLDEARVPMRALAAASVVLVYLIVRSLVGPLGGLIAAALFLGSPYLVEHLIRAKGDTTLAFFMLLALLSGATALRGAAAPSLRWSLLAGVPLGLAVGAKLTALVAVVSVSLWGALRAIRAPAPVRSGGTLRSRLVSSAVEPGVVWAALVVATAALVFVASNPYLYGDPLGRFILMLENRSYEMSIQAATEPYKAVTSPIERILLPFERGLLHETWGMSYLGWPAEATLALAGFGWLLLAALRRPPAAEAFVLLAVVCIFGGVSWGLGYRQQHYFLPCALAGLILAGVGAGSIVGAVSQGAARIRYRVRAPARVSADGDRTAIPGALPAEG